MRIQHKLTVMLLLFAVLPIVTVVLVDMAMVRPVLYQQVGTSSVELARLSLGRINEYLYAQFEHVRIWSTSFAREDIAHALGRERMSQSLAENVDIHGEFHYAIVLDPSGEVVAASDDDLVGRRLSGDPGFRAAMRGEPSVQDVALDPLVGTYSVVISFPIGDPQEARGVVSAALKWDNVNRIVTEVEIAGKAQTLADHLMLTNSDGLVISCYDPGEMFITNLVERGMKSSANALAGKEGFLLELSEHDLRSFCAYTYMRKYKGLPELGWALVLEQDPKRVFASVNVLRQTVAYSLAGVVAAIVVASLLLARRLARPLMTLAGAADGVAAGDLSVRVPVTSKDEVGVLSESFNNMVGQLVHAGQALRASEEKFRLMFETSPLGMVLCEMDGTFVQANRAYLETIGYSHEEALKLRYWDVTPGEYDADEAEQLRSMEETGRYGPYEKVYIRKTGERVPVLLNGMVVKGADGVERIWSIVENITERKQAEEERRRFEVQIQHTQKLESLGVLAGGIAHDFNNLLMGVLGNADIALLDLSPVSPVRENLVDIKKASQRAAELAKQMLAYSGKGRFIVEPLDLSEAVEEMAHMLEVSVSKSVVLKYEFGDNLPAVNADATQIRQVIMNLITNASEAIGDKSGIIVITTGAMQVDRTYLQEMYLDENLPDGLYVTLEVTDTGCGMDTETRAKIFDPFFTTKFTGRGLGMAAVLGIIRGHGGAIRIYSEVGKGTSIKVLLPAVEAEAVSAGKTETAVDWRGSGTVLLVDDDETVRAIGATMLGRLGMRVITVVDGREAVDVFRKRPDEIDCVILDLTMPRMGGEDAFRGLRSIRNDLPIIMSSGYNEQEVTQRFVGKGIAGFVQKPYELKNLAAVLRSVFDR